MTDAIRTMGPGSMTIGEADSAMKFDFDATNVILEPKTDTEDAMTFLDGHTEAGEATTTWAVSGTLKENYGIDSPQVFCFKNQGKSLPFTFAPNKGAALGFKGNLQIAPLSFGGDVKKKNDVSFSFAATDVEMTTDTQPAASTEA